MHFIMTDKIRIYHNPRCSKSRQTLALIETAGIQPEIVLYLDSPPSATELKEILNKLQLRHHDLLRKNEDLYKTQNLADPGFSDQALIEVMCAHPKLIERPIVVKGSKAVIGRPPENVNILL